MPWKETCTMDQKIKMIGDYLIEEYTINDLSEMYEVSRMTIYKWIERYKATTEGIQCIRTGL